MARQEESIVSRISAVFALADNLETLIRSSRPLIRSEDERKLIRAALTVVEEKARQLQTTIDGNTRERHFDNNGGHQNAPQYAAYRQGAHYPAHTGNQQRYLGGQDQRTRVYRPNHGNNVDAKANWATFRKQPGIPDEHKIYLPRIDMRKTEEDLYYYFSAYGQVIDVRIFVLPPPRKWNVACVGFKFPDVAKGLIGTHFGRDWNFGVDMAPQPYMSKPTTKTRIMVRQSDYQIFLGGIPVQCTADDVGIAIKKHLVAGIRDIRMIFVEENERMRHRGFAYIDLESDEDANHLLNMRFFNLGGRKVEFKANTRSKENILNDPKTIPPEQVEEVDQNSSDNTSAKGHDLDEESVVTMGLMRSTADTMPHEQLENDDPLCVICRTNKKECVLLPCGHDDTCSDCGGKLKNCPRLGCWKPIEGLG